MLDDLKFIHDKDSFDALGINAKQGEQLVHEFEIAGQSHYGDIVNIVYGGMGGSALAALLMHTWPTVWLPFEVLRDYDVPAYIGEKTLFIAASYSGNTEETLAALEQAEAKGAQIAVIAGGGKLADRAREKNYPYILLPKAAQPRYAVLYNYKALLQLLAAAGVLKEDVKPELAATATFLTEAVKAWLPDVPTAKNPAKQLAQELMGKSPVVYGGPKMAPAAYKWKISFNENAKNVAWWNEYSEFNHNEFMGWVSHPTDKPYGVIDLRSSFEHPQILKRFVISDKLLSGKRPAAHVVEAQGQSVLQHLLWTIAFGDFVSLYLALLNGVDPAPVELVERLKKEL